MIERRAQLLRDAQSKKTESMTEAFNASSIMASERIETDGSLIKQQPKQEV